jgi:ribose-phosphate pyrophosphokinase
VQIYNIEQGDKAKYDLIRFPGGELHVRIHEPVMAEVEKADSIAVTSRVNNSDKLIETFLLCDAVRQDTERQISLILPYLPYARADRRFSSGDCFGIATLSRLVNSANVNVVTLDAHSAQGLQCFHRIMDLPSDPFIEKAYTFFSANKTEPVTLLFPDKGARQRYGSISDSYEHVLHCSKERDLLTGKLKGFKVPEASEFKTKKVLLVDDICDGGGTFNGIGHSLEEYGLSLALYVTHGIFSKGLDELSKHFARIYTTDSFSKTPVIAENVDSSMLTIFPTQEYFLERIPALQRT